jgi:hypothetical protein
MRLIPFPFYPAVEKTDLAAYECSDRIVVPKSLYYLYSFPTSVLRLANAEGESVGGGLHGFHDEDETTLYVPSWMFSRFTIPEVSVTSVKSVPCGTIQVLPPSDSFFKAEGVIAAFNRALLGYKTLTQHTHILVDMGTEKGKERPLYIRIELLHPANPETLVIHNVGNVSLAILRAEEDSTGFSVLNKRAAYIPFAGMGRVLKVGATEEDDVCRKRMREAAMKRLLGAGFKNP